MFIASTSFGNLLDREIQGGARGFAQQGGAVVATWLLAMSLGILMGRVSTPNCFRLRRAQRRGFYFRRAIAYQFPGKPNGFDGSYEVRTD